MYATPMRIDVEQQLSQCVQAIGDRLVPDLVGLSPSFDNADYLFDEFDVVAELKILAVDQMHEPRNERFNPLGSAAIVDGRACLASARK